MTDTHTLRLLADLMGWSDDLARSEFRWVRGVAALRYDDYRDFTAGIRFAESLIIWLRQFKTLEDRRTAFSFVKERLVYISAPEIQRLVENLYFRHIEPMVIQEVATKVGTDPWLTFANADARAAMKPLLRRILFMALSDGARIDALRRANAKRLSNEQIVHATQIDEFKWQDLLKNLREDVGHDALFRTVYLIDDFVASGTTMLKKKPSGDFGGKLMRFIQSIEKLSESPFENNFTIRVHHYMAGADGREALQDLAKQARESGAVRNPLEFTYGVEFPRELKLGANDSAILAIAQKYYNKAELDRPKHGAIDIWDGYAHCALPVVLEHNAPNNSIPLIWAECDGEIGHRARPLFRRRERHG